MRDKSKNSILLAVIAVIIVLVFIHNPVDGYITEGGWLGLSSEGVNTDELENLECTGAPIFRSCTYDLPFLEWRSKSAMIYELSKIKNVLWASFLSSLLGVLAYYALGGRGEQKDL